VVDMTTNDNDWPGQDVLVDHDDPEWVADLFDTLRQGDLEVAIAGLESLLVTLRHAARARRVLATLRPSLICQGLRVSASRRSLEQ
jgi:hypothetical protein